MLIFFEGTADVLVVLLALDLLHLSEGSVGFLQAAFGLENLRLLRALGLRVERERARQATGAARFDALEELVARFERGRQRGEQAQARQ